MDNSVRSGRRRLIRKGDDIKVARWAAGKLGCVFVQPYTAWGITDENNRMVGAVVFNDWADKNVELTFVGRGSLSRRLFKEIAHYAFTANGVARVTVRTRAKNLYVRRIIEKAGFKPEGTLRCWYGDDDAIVYGMTKQECRFL